MISTLGKVGGDVVVAEGDPIITRESKTIANATGSDVVLTAGYPMDDNVPCLANGLATMDGILIQPVRIPAGETRDVAVLVRGPAAVNSGGLPTHDYAGTAITAATLKAAIAALGIIVRDEPAAAFTQTT